MKTSFELLPETDENSKAVSTNTNSNSQSGKLFDPKEWNLDRFEFGRPLGSGRFGNVYLVREKESEFVCVLKCISLRKLKSPSALKLLCREIEINSNLNHSGVLKMYGYFLDEKRLYLILEYATEGDLFGILRKQPEGRFEERVAACYVAQLIDALIYIHSKNIIHRDIKPENILISHVN